MDYVEALKIANEVIEKYREDQPKWWKRLDGTPMLNDIPARMAEAFAACKKYAAWGQPEKVHEAAQEALKAFDAFWPDDRPENEGQASEDRAIARVRKLLKAALHAPASAEPAARDTRGVMESQEIGKPFLREQRVCTMWCLTLRGMPLGQGTR